MGHGYLQEGVGNEMVVLSKCKD